MQDDQFVIRRVKEFQSSVTFLQAYYTARNKIAEFSYATWASELKFPNRSYLRFVVMGRRPINEKLLGLFVDHFKFSLEDKEYFEMLVYYTQSKSKEQRSFFGRRLSTLIGKELDGRKIEQHYEFLSDPMLPVLQTIFGFEDAPFDTKKLSELLDLEEEEISNKIPILESMGLIKDNRALKTSWTVPAAAQALGHKEFYRHVLHRAEEAIEMPFDVRRFRCLLVAMNEVEFTDFLKDFEAFVKEQLVKRDVSQLEGRRLYQLNFNFFPVSKSLATKD